MALQKANWLHAIGSFVGATAAIVNAGSGNWSVVRNGAGDYTITLNDQIDPSQCEVFVQAQGAHRISQVTKTSDTQIGISWITDAAAPSDPVNVSFLVVRTFG